jgi:hypothetical protein
MTQTNHPAQQLLKRSSEFWQQHQSTASNSWHEYGKVTRSLRLITPSYLFFFRLRIFLMPFYAAWLGIKRIQNFLNPALNGEQVNRVFLSLCLILNHYF